MTSELDYIKIYKRILEAKKILIFIHKNPDGDCIGAAAALSSFISGLNKTVNIFIKQGVPDNLKYLNINNVVNNFDEKEYNLFIMADVYLLSKCDVFKEVNYENIIIFDHHNTCKSDMGSIVVSDSKASSTCEIIYYFLSSIGHKITKDISISLLTGILTDTDSFNNQATNKNSINITKELLKLNADTDLIYKNLYKNQKIDSLKLFSLILSRIRKNDKLGIVWTYFTKDDLKIYELEEDDIFQISALLNEVYDCNFIMVIKQIEDNILRFSLRTNKEIDLSKICEYFGGGGHKKAAGFTINGKIEDIIHKIAIL